VGSVAGRGWLDIRALQKPWSNLSKTDNSELIRDKNLNFLSF